MLNNPEPFQEVAGALLARPLRLLDAALESIGDVDGCAPDHLWREQGTGNLRTLLLAMARDWIMLEWLDGVLSTTTAPNENFPREFWELFTLGVDNGYTQADIVEAAQAFTGYRTRYNVDDEPELRRVRPDAPRHGRQDRLRRRRSRART